MLADLPAGLPREPAGRRIVHSFSTRGFASGRVEEVSEAAYECAASGIDVCYFCMSGDVGAPPSDKSPSDARKELVNSFRAAGEDLRRTSRLSTSGDPRPARNQA